MKDCFVMFYGQTQIQLSTDGEKTKEELAIHSEAM